MATAAEKQMHAVQDKACEQLREKHGDHIVEVLFSWHGLDLVMDVKLAGEDDLEGISDQGWMRYGYVADDSLELAEVGKLK